MKIYTNSGYRIPFENVMNGSGKGVNQICAYSAEEVWDGLKNIPIHLFGELYQFTNAISDNEAIYVSKSRKMLIINIDKHINIDIFYNKPYWMNRIYRLEDIKRDNKKYRNKTYDNWNGVA